MAIQKNNFSVAKRLFAALTLGMAVLFASCQSETLPLDPSAIGGTEPGVSLALTSPNVTISVGDVSTKGSKTLDICHNSKMLVQLVDANGNVLTHKNGKPQQSQFTVNGTNEWVFTKNESANAAEWSQPILVTAGAGNYRMRIVAAFKLNSEQLFTPISYYGSVQVSNVGNGTGSFALNLKPNLSAALQVKLLRDNGAEIPSGSSYTVTVHAETSKLPYFGVSTDFSTFPNMKFTTHPTTYAELSSDAVTTEVNTSIDLTASYSNVTENNYRTGLLPCLIPKTVDKSTHILTVKKDGGNSFNVKAPSAMTFEAGKKHTLTVALGPKDATITGFGIANMDDGGEIGVTNRYIVKDGDHYKIYNAKGMKAFSDIVNGADKEYTINEIKISTTGTPNANGMLMQHIDLISVCSESLQKSWKSLGTTSKPYTGAFDGNRYTISNLYIDPAQPSATYKGFFGSEDNLDKIKDLTVTAVK